jgi:hypothetical protein
VALHLRTALGTDLGTVYRPSGPDTSPPATARQASSPERRNSRLTAWRLSRGQCAQQAYYLYVSPSAKVLSAWEPYVKNFSPNISLDYGGRLMIAWLDG